MDFATQGMMPRFWNAHFDWQGPWHRAVSRKDKRYTPALNGGRRMKHPFLTDIVYPRTPDKTANFDQDPMRRVKSIVTKTLDSSAVSKFPEVKEDVIIREVWLAETLSTFTKLARQFYTYLITPLPPGRFIGWIPTDKSPKAFFIDIIDVEVGNPEAYFFEELGSTRSYYMREQLTISFKLVREFQSPVGQVVFIGA